VLSYIDQNLSSGETVLYRTRLHWIAMISHFIAALVVAAAGSGLLFASFSKIHDKSGDSGQLAVFGLLLLVAAIVIVVVAFWKRSATEMAVTNKRVLVKVGLLSRRSTQIMLSKIESVHVDQSVVGRLFSFGTIVIRGVGGTPEPFVKIANPLEFWNEAQEQIDKLQESRTAILTH
jgi:uncharacterized membrane protein YdbT with pleckstrin-like domain